MTSRSLMAKAAALRILAVEVPRSLAFLRKRRHQIHLPLIVNAEIVRPVNMATEWAGDKATRQILRVSQSLSWLAHIQGNRLPEIISSMIVLFSA
jgi:hypothetical protein